MSSFGCQQQFSNDGNEIISGNRTAKLRWTLITEPIQEVVVHVLHLNVIRTFFPKIENWGLELALQPSAKRDMD